MELFKSYHNGRVLDSNPQPFEKFPQIWLAGRFQRPPFFVL